MFLLNALRLPQGGPHRRAKREPQKGTLLHMDNMEQPPVTMRETSGCDIRNQHTWSGDIMILIRNCTHMDHVHVVCVSVCVLMWYFNAMIGSQSDLI